MIKTSEADFQVRPDSPYNWCETNFFPFCIPEERINGNVYMFTRPALGVAMCDVLVQDRIAPAWEDQLYVDNQQHLPCPTSLLDYALPNGLVVKAVVPLKHYRLDYVGFDETELHLDYRALMEPYDLNDPEMDPLAGPRIGKGWGKSFSGHYEITCRITGTVRLRGRTHAVDCIDTIDRSWGIREESGKGNAVWMHGSFGEELTIHALFGGGDPASDPALGTLVSGYVLENGAVHGLVEGRGSAVRLNALPLSVEAAFVDRRGRRFVLSGAAVNACAWAPFPSLIYPQSLMRWSCEGRTGWGIHQEIISRAYMTRNRTAMRTA